MHFSFEADKALNCWASEYLAARPERGHALKLRRLGLTFHGITDCLCLGSSSQAFLPVEAGGALPYIFRDSCPYRPNEGSLPRVAFEALREGGAPVTLPEAAPFFPPGGDNLWHWLTESLTKVLALESSGYTGPYIIPRNSSVAAQTLELLGVDQARLLPSGRVYRVERLLVPPRLSGFDLQDYLPLCELLRNSLLKACPPSPGVKRCYLRRIGTRRVINEENILELLREFDFTVLTPEELSLKDQLSFMGNVECSVMPHGAGSALTIMQKPRSTFIELFSNRYISYNNMHSVRLLKLRYHPLVEDLDVSSCTRPEMTVCQYLGEGAKADMLIDATMLRVLLENALE